MKKTALLCSILIAVLLALMAASVCFGSVAIPFKAIVDAVFGFDANEGGASSSTVYIVRSIRLPRVLCAVFAGGLLALCGLVFQSVFRNPMADSYVLGVSSGASCLIGFDMLLSIGLGSTTAAMVGSTIACAVLFAVSNGDHNRLLLNGIAMNFLLSALTTLSIYLGRRQLDSVLYWTMGSLNGSTWTKVAVLAVVSVVSSAALMMKASALDLLLLDDSTAISSGLDVKAARLVLLAMASALTAIVVSFCGIIGFVGLMSPLFARLMAGSRHRRLVPISMLVGAVILTSADLISRVLIAPSELPIGIVTAILGSPVFIFLLRRRSNGF